MYKILTLNNISPKGLERLPRDDYEIASEIQHPDAILLRSYNMHDMEIPPVLKAVGRAGAGVNNIPVDRLSERGIPVFNAPGANANAVKELVLAGMLLACRNICQAWDYTRRLEAPDDRLGKQVEEGKKKFAGFELPGRTLGVVGLGAIGVRVANAAVRLGMNVVGFDPQMTVQSAWKLHSKVKGARSIDELMEQADFLTFHVPLVEATRNLVNPERIKEMKQGAVVLNFARDGVVDDDAVVKALDEGKLHAYITDFPANHLIHHDKVVCLPHLGASTEEAEDNSATMVAEQVRDFLENGNIHNSVNFPEIDMPRAEESAYRMAIANANVPNMLGQISSAMAEADLNIVDMINKSRGNVAYTVVDVDQEVSQAAIDKIKAIQGVLNVRVL